MPGPAGDSGKSPHLVGPGLKLTIDHVAIDVGGSATVTFSITDEDGVPLDIDGIYTEGAVTPRFVLAWLDETADKKPLQYTAYTTKKQTSPLTNVTADQAAADEGGVFKLIDEKTGTYTYTFGTVVNVAAPGRTHTLGVWATRDFEGARYVANVLYDFLPDGGAPSVKRDVVTTEGCNACHNPLAAHGGARREAGLCLLCHSPQSTDPDTGNTVDFKVMIHKIHRGKGLPSVAGGKPYQIIGFQGAVHDYSTVAFPQEIQRCAACHTGSQGEVWKEQAPTKLVCSSCHDLVSFDPAPPPGMIAHLGGPQADESKCSVCHPPSGGLEGIETKHLTANYDPAALQVKLTIKSVTNTAPGQNPQILFDAELNGAPLDLLATPLTRLAVTMAGPTSDYASYTTYTIQGTGATGTLTAQAGSFLYTLPTPVAVNATGSVAFGLEGYTQPGGAAGPRYSAPNVVAYAAVTDAAPVARRAVVDVKQCNSCHYKLGAHGGQRNDPEYCALCHNPTNVNDERISRFEGAEVVAPSVDLPVMIHRIHMGEDLTEPYMLFGFPAPTKANPAGTPINFGEVRYPGDRKACWACHAGATYTLPLVKGLTAAKVGQALQCTEDPAADPDSYCDQRVVAKEMFMQPEAAACTGCHDAPYVQAHAETMTSASGVEACATCHGPGADFDVQRVHAPAP